MDSVESGLHHWMAHTPGVDAGDDRAVAAEAARQRIGRLSRAFSSLLDEIAEASGITTADWAALSVIARSPNGHTTPGELGSALHLTSGTVSTRLRRLVDAGLVEVLPTDDRRSRPVHLTPSGHKQWSEATQARIGSERDLFDALDDDDLRSLNRILRDLLAPLEDRYGPAPAHDRVG